MTWFGWVLLMVWGVSLLLAIAQIGKPRKATTSGDVIAQMILLGLMVAGVLAVGTGSL